MKSLPDDVATPYIVTDNDEIITIGWTAADNCNAAYGSDCHYEVTVTTDGVSQVYTTPFLTYTEWGINTGASYCFQVRACNSCGVGQRSEPVCVEQCIRPMIPAAPKIMDNSPPNEINVQWNYDPTSACFNQRCHYTIVITKSDGTDDEIYTTWTPTYRY